MTQHSSIKIAQSYQSNAKAAVEEFYDGVYQPDMAFVIFFSSHIYNTDELARAIAAKFGAITVVGCTTAGEIGVNGYCQHSLVGVSFSAKDACAVMTVIPDLTQFDSQLGHSNIQSLLQKFEVQTPHADTTNSFAFMLIDGLSIREEFVARIVQNELGQIPLLGGSAGDGLKFKKTLVYADGQFQENSAVILLCHTQLPFYIFRTQHFITTDKRMVVTKADDSQRIVYEINGLPAALEYARLVGVNLAELNPHIFAKFPVAVVIDDIYYVRSIQKQNADDSLTFYCAIEEGIVLRLAIGVDLYDNLQAKLAQINKMIGTPQLVLLCDCLLRKLEIEQSMLIEPINHLLKQYNTIGFSTYGEQFHTVHVNQTLTGISFGYGA